MRAGKLRHRVIFKASSAVKDGYGAETLTWTTYATVWAAIEPISGREMIQADQMQAETTIRVRVRYNASVEPEHRIYFGTRVLEIVSVINLTERNRHLELLCKEIDT